MTIVETLNSQLVSLHCIFNLLQMKLLVMKDIGRARGKMWRDFPGWK